MMFNKLIYSVLAVASIGAFSACNSTDSDVPQPTSEMKFEAAEMSRASLTTDASIKNSPFAVFGDMVSSSAAAGTAKSIVFNNTAVTHNGEKWVYDNPQYWFPDFTYSFVAIHPASVVNPASAVDPGVQYSNNQLSFKYTQPPYSEDDPAAYRSTPDILAATHRRAYTYKSNQPAASVAFNFAHILSRINFIAEVKTGQQYPIVIESFIIRNVLTSATYTIAPAAISGSDSQTDDYTGGEWTNHIALPEEGNQLLLFPVNSEVKINPGASRQFFSANNNPLFVIPQEIPENIEVSIAYHAVDNNNNKVGDSVVIPPTNLHQFTLQHGGEWLPGKSYNYTFAIGIDTDIIFKTPIVEDWTESLGGNYIIPD